MSVATRRTLVVRIFVSGFLAACLLGALVSGAVRFLSPPGRVANWTDGAVAGLTKRDWTALHISFSAVFLGVAAVHVFFNWRPVIGYFKDRGRRRAELRPGWVTALAAGLIVTLTGCRPGPEPASAALPPAVGKAAVERGRAIAGQAFALLSTNLARAIATGGITNALPYCSERAYPLTALVAASNQVTLQRLTHKPRNSTNRVSDVELEVLRGFQLSLGRGEPPTPVVRALGTNLVSFYSPIVITNPLCLQCHGSERDIQPPVAALIRQLYPHDEATGFKLGDLRGAWRVDFPRGALTPPAP